jgi:hypothetical protein
LLTQVFQSWVALRFLPHTFSVIQKSTVMLSCIDAVWIPVIPESVCFSTRQFVSLALAGSYTLMYYCTRADEGLLTSG